jgi:hypothetical protein
MISQQQRLIYIPLVGTIILCLLVGLSLAVRRHFSKSTSSKKVTKHKVEAPPDDALKYWTADKMRNAKAVPLPRVNTLDPEKLEPRPSPKQDTE